MSHSALAAGLRHLRNVIASQHYREDSDEQLLHTFAAQRDDSAFAALVRRHGPMVLNVCRRVLGQEQDAEDAFQATFLVLAQSAATLRKKASLASFLHGTAHRLALSVKRAAARRRKHESQVAARPSVDPANDLSWREVRALVDEEIARLPEKYRSAFILCCLEELSRAEAAQRLGVNENTLSSRLAEARKRLSQRLACRGVELTAVLAAASTLATQAASALSPLLISTTTKAALATALGQGTAGLISAQVAGLVKCAASTKILSKIAVFLALAAGAAALGTGVAFYREPPTPPADPPRAEAAPKPPAAKPAGAVTVRGRVLGPDGEPVKGARLHYPHLRTPQPRSEDDIEYPERAKTDAEGRFRFELPRDDIRVEFYLRMNLIAVADGYGADWTALSADNLSAELTLRLVKDLPIDGRIISTEGKPLADGRVCIVSLATTPQGKLDPFLTAWKQEWGLAFRQTPKRLYLPMDKVFATATTDKDGRFRIGGAGTERVAQLQVRGPGISQGSLYVIGRDGFDPAEINKAVLARTSIEERRLRQPPLLYGPKLTFVAESARRIEGTVREAGSGKPVAGYMIHCGAGYNNGLLAVSDKEGRYRLDGLPKMKQYLLGAWPPANGAWLKAGARVEDREGLQPITVDFTVARGVLLSGRIIDKTAGKGVRGHIRFVPLPGNPFANKPGYDSYKYERLQTPTGADGRFKLAVIPGPGVLMVQADGKEKVNGGLELNPYKQGEFDAKDREQVKIVDRGDALYFTTVDNTLEFLISQNAVKVLDLAPDAGTAKCDLFVERGTTQIIKIEDPEGKPLTGTTVAGMTASGWDTFPIKDSVCTVFALDSKKPRRVLFIHAERKLAGSLTLRGDEKEPPVVRLGPAGSVIGRVLDRDGQPLSGASIDLSSPDRTARELYRQLRQRQATIRTDKDGRFRIEGIVPEVKFTLGIVRGRTFFVGEPRIGARQVKPGETLDLGAVRVKPGP
jgi:RNA polymerase sigma factor (sigma-70 family)